MNLSEEFNLESCLIQLERAHEYFKNIGKIVIVKNTNHVFEVQLNRKVTEDLTVIEKIEISNFMIKVEKLS